VDGQPIPEKSFALRRISAIELRKIKPATIATELPVFKWVDPRSLLVDESYQRNISRRSRELIEKIISRWDWRRYKPPVVASTPDGLEVIDGQHTAIAAASHPEITTIPVMIVIAGDRAGRASAFIGHNHDRVAITRLQMHRAAVTAGEDQARILQTVCRRAGITLLRTQPPQRKYLAGETIAVGAIQKLIERRGPSRAHRVLELLCGAALAPVAAASIRAVELLLYDDEFAGKIDNVEIGHALAMHAEPRDHEARLFAATHHIPYWKALGIVMFKGKARKAQAPRSRDASEEKISLPNPSDRHGTLPDAVGAAPEPALESL
jgi:hypothetical protein